MAYIQSIKFVLTDALAANVWMPPDLGGAESRRPTEVRFRWNRVALINPSY
jgi:hypothetical protein